MVVRGQLRLGLSEWAAVFVMSFLLLATTSFRFWSSVSRCFLSFSVLVTATESGLTPSMTSYGTLLESESEAATS